MKQRNSNVSLKGSEPLPGNPGPSSRSSSAVGEGRISDSPGVWSASVLGLAMVLVVGALLGVSCGRRSGDSAAAAADPQLKALGTLEVTAQLVEIPEGAIFKRDLYDYATILKYQVLQVHRGQVEATTLFVGHYNPWKPRAEAADKRVKGIGGNLRQFRAGETHRMALEVPIDDHFMGGIVNKYFGQETGRSTGRCGRMRNDEFVIDSPMVFTTHIFVFYFLPLFLLVYFGLPRAWRNLWITVASYVFYGWWEPWFVCLMMFTTVMDFIWGKVITRPGATRAQRKARRGRPAWSRT